MVIEWRDRCNNNKAHNCLRTIIKQQIITLTTQEKKNKNCESRMYVILPNAKRNI